MPLTRTEHWATREFDAHLHEHAHRAYVWGEHDCCLGAANAIQAFTGVDLAAPFRGRYHDETSAMALIHELTGGSTIEDAVAWCAAQHGLVEWMHGGKPAPLLAQRGDLVLLEHDGGRQSAGVVHLRGTHVVCVGVQGAHRLSIRSIKRAWKV